MAYNIGITVELSKAELQYLLNAIDTHIRANGVTSAATGAILAQKMQVKFNELPADVIEEPKE